MMAIRSCSFCRGTRGGGREREREEERGGEDGEGEIWGLQYSTSYDMRKVLD